jgi:hypothetical protein
MSISGWCTDQLLQPFWLARQVLQVEPQVLVLPSPFL